MPSSKVRLFTWKIRLKTLIIVQLLEWTNKTVCWTITWILRVLELLNEMKKDSPLPATTRDSPPFSKAMAFSAVSETWIARETVWSFVEIKWRVPSFPATDKTLPEGSKASLFNEWEPSWTLASSETVRMSQNLTMPSASHEASVSPYSSNLACIQQTCKLIVHWA